MLRGLYTAASGMIAQQRRHDIVTNNIANVSTPGFKQGVGINRSFPEALIASIGGGSTATGSSGIGKMNMGVLAEENVSLYVQGDVLQTNNLFDFALISDIQVDGAAFDASGKYIDENGQHISQPQAFFTVVNQAGEQRYSQNGKFTVNVNGEVIAVDGSRVLGQDGQPLVMLDQAGNAINNFMISKTGQFFDGNGQAIVSPSGQPMSLLLTRVDDPNQLIREGNGMYYLEEGQQELAKPVNPEDQVEVKQGYIERSNVDVTQASVDMMAALRAYEANQKVIQYFDKSMEKAVNEVGRV